VALVIDAGKADIFIRQRLKAFNSLLYADVSFPNRF